MLPMIENNSNVQLEEIPFRLPSRLQTYNNSSRLEKSYTAKISIRKDTYYRRAKTSCSMNFVLEDEQIKRPVNSCVDKSKMEISPQLFSHLNNELSHKSLIDQNRTFSSSKQTGNICFKEELSEILYSDVKPIWISELKRWIKENSQNYDFLKLTNTATLHENKLWKDLSVKLANFKETNELKRNAMQIDNKRKETIHHFKILNSESPKKNVKIIRNLPSSKDKKINKKKISTNEYEEIIENKLLPIKSEFTEEVISNLESHVIENPISYNSSEESNKEIMKNSESNENTNKNVIKNEENKNNENKNDENKNNENKNNENKNDENKSDVNTENTNLEDKYFDKNEVLQSPKEENITHNSLHDDEHTSLTNQCADDLPLRNQNIKSSTNHPFNEHVISNNSNEIIPIQTNNSNRIITKKSKKNLSTNIRLKQKKIPFENESIKTQPINSDVSLVENENKIELQSDSENQNELDDKTFEKTFDNNVTEISELSNLPILPENNITEEIVNNNASIRDKLAPLLNKQKARWGIKKIEMHYSNLLANERRAEERRLRFINLINKVKNKKKKEIETKIPEDPRYESYGFLAKYCILEKLNVSLYRNTFDVCDESKKQWLNENELIMALKGVNSNLKEFHINYLNMVMSTCGYNLQSGADFKLFAILAALSVKIIKNNSWIKSTLGNSDFKTLEKKTYLCRKLWEINVDPVTNTIPLHLLSIELKAGGVKEQHIDEINERLGFMKELNILDFLTYIPLFILVHSSILNNPLDMSQNL